MVKEVLQYVADDPSLAEALPGADDYIRAEVPYAVTHEGARHLDDVLARRTRASIETWDRGTAGAQVVADLMAPLLEWSPEQVEREVSHYVARVEAERASQQQPDDATADAARLGAEDIVPIG
jgi:glycerol-3-phosphate dehydrogenase